MADSGGSLTILPNGELGLCEHYSEDNFVGSLDGKASERSVIQSFREYWEPIEVMFGDDPGAEKLNAAIRTWLSIRFPKVRIHDKSETYSVFKTYIEDEHAGTPEELLDELRGFCFMWAENYNFHEVKEFRCMNWAKGKRRTLVPERASQGGF